MSRRRSSRLVWHWPRFRARTRTIMAAVFIAACGLGWLVHRERVQREAVVAIHRANGYAEYEWRAVSKDGLTVYHRSPRVPRWLLDMIGVDYFGSVVVVGVATGGPPPAGLVASIAQLNRLEELALSSSFLNDDEMAHIGGLTTLTKLVLCGSRFTEAGFTKLSRLHRLAILNLQGADVTDAAVTSLAGLENLEYLDLRNTHVTDNGLARLRSLSNLKVLVLSGPKFTDAGVRQLQQALPNLTIRVPDRSDLTIHGSARVITRPMPPLVPPGAPRPTGSGSIRREVSCSVRRRRDWETGRPPSRGGRSGGISELWQL